MGLPRPLRDVGLIEEVRLADEYHATFARKGKLVIEVNYDEKGAPKSFKVFPERGGDMKVPA